VEIFRACKPNPEFCRWELLSAQGKPYIMQIILPNSAPGLSIGQKISISANINSVSATKDLIIVEGDNIRILNYDMK
jgi:hypothetical protein